MGKKIAIIENNILATNTIRKSLTQALMEVGHDVTVITTGSLSKLAKARNQQIKIVDVKQGDENILHTLFYILNLRRTLKSLKPDVCLTFTIRPNIWGNFVARWLRIPAISTITGTGLLFDSKERAYRLAKWLYKMALKKTRRIFFQNQDDRNQFLKHQFVDPENTEITPGSGVDTDYFLPQEMPGKSGSFTILFIGRLIRDKGIYELVKAAEVVKKSHPDIIFQIVGPVWDRSLRSSRISHADLEKWIQQGTIRYEGQANDVRSFIAGADCIVLPSYREGMSNILLEAGSMEKPCIATDVTGCKEIIDDGITGFLCRPRDSNDLVEKILNMYHLPVNKRNEMGQAARKKIKGSFEKEIVIGAYLRAIEKI